MQKRLVVANIDQLAKHGLVSILLVPCFAIHFARVWLLHLSSDSAWISFMLRLAAKETSACRKALTGQMQLLYAGSI